MEKEKKPVIKEQDLLELLARVLKRKRFIFVFTVVSFVVGVLLAFTSIKEYTVEIMVSPENPESSSFSGDINSLASMVGLDFNSTSDAIYPLLYPDIVSSLPFLTSLMDVRVTSSDGLIDTTYSYYQAKLKKKDWFREVVNTPKKWINKFVGLFKKEDKNNEDPFVFDPYRLSESQLSQIEGLNNQINVFVDKKTEVITLSFKDSDPEIAAIMAKEIESELEKRVVDYRTRKAQEDCQYMEKLYLESKAEYEKAQAEYADFVDHNRNITLERVLIEKDRLEAEKDLKNLLYSQWAQQLLLSQAKLQHNTPVFSIIKPAAVPAKSSSMRRLYLLIFYTALGFSIAVGWVLLKDPVCNVIRKIKGFL